MKKLNTAQAELVKRADEWLGDNYPDEFRIAYPLIEDMRDAIDAIDAIDAQPDYKEIAGKLGEALEFYSHEENYIIRNGKVKMEAGWEGGKAIAWCNITSKARNALVASGGGE